MRRISAVAVLLVSLGIGCSSGDGTGSGAGDQGLGGTGGDGVGGQMPGTQATGGSDVVPTCTDVCVAGTAECFGNAVRRCAAQATGCTNWDAPTPCAVGETCQAGVCASGCVDQCAIGTSQCAGLLIQQCVSGAGGCTVWAAAEECRAGQTCNGEACAASCVDTCAEGASQCVGTTQLQTCSRQANGCTDWNPATACPLSQACSAGACVASCTDLCFENSTRCMGVQVQTCARQATGCADWNAAVACPSGQECQLDTCADLGGGGTGGGTGGEGTGGEGTGGEGTGGEGTGGEGTGGQGSGGEGTGGQGSGGEGTGGADASTGGYTGTGCESGALSDPIPDCSPTPIPDTGDYYADCVERINQFRWECQCLPPLERWVEGEACADQQAQHDYEVDEYHAGFSEGICEPRGSAQNECPGYSENFGIVDFCLQQMWDEGPGQDFNAHGHYINMSSTDYSRVACGIYTTSGGEIWAVQNFSR